MTEEQLYEDVLFLAMRAEKAGQINTSLTRDYGASSNSIVSIAYGLQYLAHQTYPRDRADLNACKEMWRKLPAHRKVGDALAAYKKALSGFGEVLE